MNTFYLGKQFTSFDDRLLISQEHRTTAWSLLKGTLLSQYIFPPMVAYSFLGVVETYFLLCWLALHLLLNTCRLYFIYFWFPSLKHKNKHTIFDFGVLFSSFLSSLLWVYMMFYIDPSISPEHTVFYYVVIFGLASGAIGVGICWPIYFVNYISILLLGFVAAVILQYTQVNFILVLSIFAYMGFLVHICFTLNEKSAENIILKIRNADLAKSFDEQRAYADNLAQEKNHLLATTSHDLRQPLQAMNFFIASLKSSRETFSDANLQLIERLDSSVESMSDLLSSMLDISRLDANAIDANIQPVCLNTMLAKLSDQYSLAAKNKGIQFALDPVDAYILTDSVLCERLISNVLSNAIKYTESGSVIIEHEVNDTTVNLTISDTGKGIAKIDQKRIFDDFIQLNNPERDKSKGLGLGLSIVKRIAQLLNIDIDLHSETDKGTRFTFRFQRCQAPTISLVKRSTAQVNKVEGKCILVIDDEQDILIGLETLMTNWGANVITCESEDDALARIGKDSPQVDLILSDFRLREGKTGVQAINAIREFYNNPDLKAFLLSGDTSAEHIREMKQQEYYLLHKPIKAMALRALLQKTFA